MLGVDLFAEREIRTFTAGARARNADESGANSLFAEFLVTPGAVTASQQTAQQLGVSVGDTFELLVDGQPTPIDYFTEIRGGLAVAPEVECFRLYRRIGGLRGSRTCHVSAIA